MPMLRSLTNNRGDQRLPPRRIAFIGSAGVLFVGCSLLLWPWLKGPLLSTSYLPHLYCYLGSSRLVWSNVLADALIAVAYFVISITLVYLVHRGRGDVPFRLIFLAFGLFIVTCGSTHLMEVVTIWIPFYVLSAGIKIATAIASVATAIALPFVVPKVLGTVHEAKLSQSRRELLEVTLVERDKAYRDLEETNNLLEGRVRERTSELSKLNREWELEVLARRRNEAQLRESEDRFSKAFMRSPLAITISTEDGRYVDVNEVFLNLLGYRREEVIGQSVSELQVWTFPEDRTKMVGELTRSGHVKAFETRFNTKLRETRIVEISAEMIQLNRIPCVLAITLDVTEARSVEQQFYQAQKMEAIGRLAGGIAHDFNNMLGVIIGFSDLLKERMEPGAAAAGQVDQIKKAAERAAALTQQLLAFSRQQVLQPTVLNLNAVVNDVQQDVAAGDRRGYFFEPGAGCSAGQRESRLGPDSAGPDEPGHQRP